MITYSIMSERKWASLMPDVVLLALAVRMHVLVADCELGLFKVPEQSSNELLDGILLLPGPVCA